MKQSRRQFLGFASLAGYGLLARPHMNFELANAAAQNAGPRQKRTRIILLGTKGGPRVGEITQRNPGRSNPSTLLLINDVPYVVDCGYGTSRQLLAAGIPLNQLRYIFITHHHSDHNLDYGPLLYNAWITGKPIRVDAYGPEGLQKMTENFFDYVKTDIEIRIPDEGRPDPRKLVSVHEFDKAGVILENSDVKVTTCLVRHPPIKAYAYRFDAHDRSVVISGDTAYAPELAQFARGADVLIHEVMYLPGVEDLVRRLPNAKRLRDHLMATHTLPAEVGKIAAEAGVKTLVLTHFVPGDMPSITDADWARDVRVHFKGRIIVGRDLLEI